MCDRTHRDDINGLGLWNPLLGFSSPRSFVHNLEANEITLSVCKGLGDSKGKKVGVKWSVSGPMLYVPEEEKKDLSFPVPCRNNREFCFLSCCSQSSVSLTPLSFSQDEQQMSNSHIIFV